MMGVEEKVRFLGGVTFPISKIEETWTSCYTFEKIPQEQLEPIDVWDLKAVIGLREDGELFNSSLLGVSGNILIVVGGDYYSFGIIQKAITFFMEENGYFWKITKFYKWLEEKKDGMKLLVIQVKEDSDGDEKGEVGYIVVCPTALSGRHG